MSEKVTRSCYGYFLGPCYLYTAECGAKVESYHRYCHACGRELIRTWTDDGAESPQEPRAGGREGRR